MAQASPPPLNPPVKVRVGSIGLSGEAGNFIAADRGYFKDEGLDVEFVPNVVGPAALAALLSNSVDLAALALDVSAINAVSRNVDMRLMTPLTYIPPGDKNASIIVRKDLVDSGKYKQPRDLKGLSIATGSAPKTSAQWFVELALAKGGLKAADATFENMNFPDMLVALGSKKVDAAWEIEPLATAAEDRGIATEEIWAGDLAPNYDPFLLVESPKFAQTQPEALRRFAAAQLRGQRDYYNAFQKNAGGADAKSSIITILANHTSVKDPKTWQELADKGRMQSVDPNDAFHLQGFDELQNYFAQVGTLQAKIDISKVIDTAPAAYALQRLGRIS